ncbi:MAG: TRAP transporter TatT component family protein [bacterium]
MNKKILALFVFAIFIMLTASGCSIRKLTANTTATIMDDVVDAFFQEQDTEFAQVAIPANLKLLDGLIKAADYENNELLLKGCKLYGMYALAFLEDATVDAVQDRENQKRAKIFYLRSKEYGMRILRKNSDFEKVADGNLDDFKATLASFNKDEVPALFWTAFSWGSYINLSKNSAQDIADLPKVRAMVERVIELDDTYFYGIPHLFMIVYYSMPKLFGGDPALAKKEYDRIKAISGNKFLMADFYMAKFYAPAMQDKALFTGYVEAIRTADDALIPEKLFTAVAKKKIEILAKKMENYF